jgi:two-component system nitrate/nitrite response regulator NarL
MNDFSAARETDSIRVLVVAAVRLYREGMAYSLERRDGLTVAGCADCRDEALRLAATIPADVVVLDMATAESLALVRGFKQTAPNVKVVAFAVAENDSDIIACAEAGVNGYVPPAGSIDDLISAIHGVMRGELLCSPRVAGTLLRRLGTLASREPVTQLPGGLTLREHEVVALIEAGLSNKEIAIRLHIEVATVKNHVHNLLDKLHVTTRAEAAAQIGARKAGPGRQLQALSLPAHAS